VIPFIVDADRYRPEGPLEHEGDHLGLAQRLRALRADQEELVRRRLTGHAAVMQNFSVDGNARRFIGVLEDAIRLHGGATDARPHDE
jgi:hypothetical protein